MGDIVGEFADGDEPFAGDADAAVFAVEDDFGIEESGWGLLLSLAEVAEVAQLEARTLVIPGDFGCPGRKSSLQKPVRPEPFR